MLPRRICRNANLRSVLNWGVWLTTLPYAYYVDKKMVNPHVRETHIISGIRNGLHCSTVVPHQFPTTVPEQPPPILPPLHVRFRSPDRHWSIVTSDTFSPKWSVSLLLWIIWLFLTKITQIKCYGLKAFLCLCAKTAQGVHSSAATVETPLWDWTSTPVKFKGFTSNSFFNKDPLQA